ncbi:MAG: imidazoleglycerol-phosphate dehydratase HisB [Spirochaetaceae bacterium]|jgi:imidazoleglycerol-phosphate dehydratase|nr:imidazoleglycerol-phosphate dehydratase HisB [Spirochaetaceae bacterium]
MSGISKERRTKETQISIEIDLLKEAEVQIATGLPFMDHMLHAMAFHGDFSLKIKAAGDIDVDPHHLVEDLGIVLGSALNDYFKKIGAVSRYAQSIIPMDDALSEIIIDVCNRPFLIYQVYFPQDRSGNFDMWLLKEFFQGLANEAKINLHCRSHYGENAHHIAEAMFKALGKSLKESYKPIKKESGQMSTKGVL